MGMLVDGIYEYDEGDVVAPTFSELLNLLGDSVRARLAVVDMPETALLADPNLEIRLSVQNGIASLSLLGSAPLANQVRWDIGSLIPASAQPKRIKHGVLQVENQEGVIHPTGVVVVMPNGVVAIRHKGPATTTATTWSASAMWVVGR